MTDAGLSALWCASSFSGVVDLESSEAEFLEDDDLRGHIRRGALVPINVGGDGAFEVVVRVGEGGTEAVLEARERARLLVSSEPYLLVCEGRAIVSGLERIWAEVLPDVLVLDVGRLRFCVTVHLIDWEAEPGSRGVDGRPSDGALPDFVVQ